MSRFENFNYREYLVYAGGSQYEITQDDGKEYSDNVDNIIEDLEDILELYFDSSEKEFIEVDFIKNIIEPYFRDIKKESLEQLKQYQKDLLDNIPENIEMNLNIKNYDELEEKDIQEFAENIFYDVESELEDIFNKDMQIIIELCENKKIHLIEEDLYKINDSEYDDVIWSNYDHEFII